MEDSGNTGSGNTGQFVERRYSSTLTGIVHTVEWVIIALILAFVFRAFVMEAFRIPTGSMAETLRGAHHHLRCEQCGYKYDLEAGELGSGGPKCPNCRFLVSTPIAKPPSNGDRILVLKCIYEFTDPKRWDVVVFKNPGKPEENYIKRLVALPGETIATLDGDFYVRQKGAGEFKILRKPPRVQDEMWMVIYDNDYQPVAATGQSASKVPFNFKQPFVNQGDSQWQMNLSASTYFTLQSDPASENTIAYNPKWVDDFRAYYAYNQTVRIFNEPVCTDLKVRFYVQRQSDAGFTSASIRKYDTMYRGRVNYSGQMVIEKVAGGETVELASKDAGSFDSAGVVLYEFMLVDRQLILQFGKVKLKYDLGQQIEDLAFSETKGSIVEISGAGNLKLSHIGVYRDIYYTEKTSNQPKLDRPFSIGDDEFFVCGDNSPHSFDSRKWVDPGEGNKGREYSKGIVPRDYLMGKAFYLYWGDAFAPLGSKVPIIPNFSEMKPIYGGSKDEL